MIRTARAEDAAGIHAIYAPIVEMTTISFEYEVPTVEEMRSRVTSTVKRFPWLVWHDSGAVLGYAYAGAFRKREAYQWSVEVSAYVHEDARRRGIGRSLYRALFDRLVRQGFYNAYAGITLPNDASVGLHEAVGFKYAGRYPRAGYKFGAWHDVGWWSLALQPHDDDPLPPGVPFPEYY